MEKYSSFSADIKPEAECAAQSDLKAITEHV